MSKSKNTELLVPLLKMIQPKPMIPFNIKDWRETHFPELSRIAFAAGLGISPRTLWSLEHKTEIPRFYVYAVYGFTVLQLR